MSKANFVREARREARRTIGTVQNFWTSCPVPREIWGRQLPASIVYRVYSPIADSALSDCIKRTTNADVAYATAAKNPNWFVRAYDALTDECLGEQRHKPNPALRSTLDAILKDWQGETSAEQREVYRSQAEAVARALWLPPI